MKTHEHAILSIGYAAGIALLSGHGLGDPGIYLSALIGGELLDFVDHPLYFLVYRKDGPIGKETRTTFKKDGIKKTIQYLKAIEEQRKIVDLRLHNVFALTLFSLVALLTSLFWQGTIYPFVILGALLLHPLADMLSNFLILGQYDNWFWILPKRMLNFFGSLGARILPLVISWWVFIFTCVFFVSFRWGWQLAYPDTSQGLFEEIGKHGREWVTFVPFLLLLGYFAGVLGIIFAGQYKYGLETKLKNRVSREKKLINSLGCIFRYIRDIDYRKETDPEKLLLRMRADMPTWITVLIILISFFMTAYTLLGIKQDYLYIITPVVLALSFGTLISTTIGEFGGVLGIFSASILNFLLSRLNILPLWPAERFSNLFIAALLAWALGLFGHIFLKGYIRMSLNSFYIQLKLSDGPDHEDGLVKILSSIKKGMEEGYKRTREILYGSFAWQSKSPTLFSDLILTTYQHNPAILGNKFHTQIEDRYIPIYYFTSYVLCDNQLTDSSKQFTKYGILPIFPRFRFVGHGPYEADMHLEKGSYYWHSQRGNLRILCAEDLHPCSEKGRYWMLTKTLGEYFDHMVNQNASFLTDIYVTFEKSKPEIINIWGVSREKTSTHEFATVESEAYCSTVYRELLQRFERDQSLSICGKAIARFVFPRNSIYDLDCTNSIEQLAILPSSYTECVNPSDINSLGQCLELLPVKNLITGATADLGKRMIVLGIQVSLGLILTNLGLDPQFYDWVKRIMFP